MQVLIVLSCFKPVVSLVRLMSGRELDGASVTEAEERSICKVIETVCESVPASIIVMVALLLSAKWPWAPIVSIAISWITTSFKATSLSLDLDTNRFSRKLTPSFYGYVPSRLAWRRVVHACLFVLTFAHVVERSAALTLLFVTRKSWLGALLGAEMGLTLLFKAIRSDFTAWIPGFGYGGSFVYRLLSKLMLDFCGLPHLRHPMEFGGAFWLFSILTNQAVCLFSAWAYIEHNDDPGKLDGILLFSTFGTLAGMWACALAGFLFSIERKYLHTFVSLEKGGEYAVRYFRDTEGDDESRIRIILYHHALWAPIRTEVKAWVIANYPRWKSEPVAWLTPGLIAKIPSDFIPNESFSDAPALVRRHRGVRGLDGDLD
jgi:hypothetical protein